MVTWFNDWSAIGNVFITGLCCFVGLVIMLRISGKRTLTKMNAFDFIMTVSVGSTLASALTNQKIAIAEGLTALATLIFIQYVIAWLSVKSPRFQSLIKATPTVLFYKGTFHHSMMKKERITKMEIFAAMRYQGFADPRQVLLVLLETNGQLSVVGQTEIEHDTGVMEVLGHPQTRIKDTD